MIFVVVGHGVGIEFFKSKDSAEVYLEPFLAKQAHIEFAFDDSGVRYDYKIKRDKSRSFFCLIPQVKERIRFIANDGEILSDDNIRDILSRFCGPDAVAGMTGREALILLARKHVINA